jgi:hypothetical protein
VHEPFTRDGTAIVHDGQRVAEADERTEMAQKVQKHGGVNPGARERLEQLHD